MGVSTWPGSWPEIISTIACRTISSLPCSLNVRLFRTPLLCRTTQLRSDLFSDLSHSPELMAPSPRSWHSALSMGTAVSPRLSRRISQWKFRLNRPEIGILSRPTPPSAAFLLIIPRNVTGDDRQEERSSDVTVRKEARRGAEQPGVRYPWLACRRGTGRAPWPTVTRSSVRYAHR